MPTAQRQGPEPTLRWKFAPLDWSRLPDCPKFPRSRGRGPVINVFWAGDALRYSLDWASDASYITVGGHGGPGDPGFGACGLGVAASPARIAQDLHALRILPGNAPKGVRIAACYSADRDPKDPKSVPLAQQVADAYGELYGEPINVEGFSGLIQFDQPEGLQRFSCKKFTSRSPLPQ